MLKPRHVRCITVGLVILEDEGTMLFCYPTLPFNHPNITILMFVKPTFIFFLINTTVQVLLTVELIYA